MTLGCKLPNRALAKIGRSRADWSGKVSLTRCSLKKSGGRLLQGGGRADHCAAREQMTGSK